MIAFYLRGRCLALATALALAGSARAELITNGSFELGVNPPGATSGFPFTSQNATGTPNLAGWTAGGAGVDWVYKSYWVAADGDRSIDLNAFDAGSLSQTFATTAGQQYTATYQLALNPDKNPNFPADRTATAVATDAGGGILGQTVTTFKFNELGSDYQNMNWQSYSVTFTATGSETTLTFVSGSSGAGGVTLDNVSVDASAPPPTPSEVPAPAGLLLGLLGAAALGVRFRRRTVAA